MGFLEGLGAGQPSMGNQQASFSAEQIEQYQDCTFFTKKEILKLHNRFRELNPSVIPQNMQTDEAMTATLTPDGATKMTELKENPFANRILEVFSEDSTGHVSFNNFVDMFNVFSEHAPRDLKAYYAFKIYDMDNDGYISMSDLNDTLRCLTREELSKEEINLV